MTDAHRPEPSPSPELDELLGAFALDAVDGDERARVAAYVRADETARREVDELRETAAMLALAPIEHEAAPADLWDRISSSLRSTSVASDSAFVSDSGPETVDDFAAVRRRMGRSVPMRFAAPIGIAAAIALAVLTVRVSADDSRSDLAAAFDTAAKRGATVELSGDANAAVALADGRGVLRTDNLPTLDPGDVYQAWSVYPDTATPISIGVFDDDTDYMSFRYADNLAAVAITVELAPGVVATDEQPVAVGAVT